MLIQPITVLHFMILAAICEGSYMGGIATSENTAQIYCKVGVVTTLFLPL